MDTLVQAATLVPSWDGLERLDSTSTAKISKNVRTIVSRVQDTPELELSTPVQEYGACVDCGHTMSSLLSSPVA